MNQLNHYPQSGHCYPDLVEKKDGKLVAEMRSTIWKDDFQRINDNFLNVLHESLKNGIKILFCAKISFNPVYGLSLRILDIDPSWSLGELEKEKQETIDRLRKEGLFHRNKSLMLPLLPKRIAVISVQTSKGYADFCKIINGNEWGYSFFHMLFPALLQGESAVNSIVFQMERIRRIKHHFDAVAVIRGGGGDVGLACYNHYELASAIAQFPLPVITGIGHSTNETVTEMVAFRNTITPTELADYLLQQFHNFSVPLKKAHETIIGKANSLLQHQKTTLLNTVRYFKSVAGNRLVKSSYEIQQEVKALQQQSGFFLHQRWEHLSNQRLMIQKGSVLILRSGSKKLEVTAKNGFSGILNFIHLLQNEIIRNEKNVDLMDPVNVLKRGYSITIAGGKVLKTVDEAAKGTTLRTILADGTIISITKSVDKTEDNE
jgi:exodeoxyribonuclease VII large subunit